MSGLIVYTIFILVWHNSLYNSLVLKTDKDEIIRPENSKLLDNIIALIAIFWIIAIPIYILPLRKGVKE